jgi:hypothetical protein
MGFVPIVKFEEDIFVFEYFSKMDLGFIRDDKNGEMFIIGDTFIEEFFV